MYELIKKQIAADYFQQRFPNDGQRFVAWYLRNILFRDINETSDDITDGDADNTSFEHALLLGHSLRPWFVSLHQRLGGAS